MRIGQQAAYVDDDQFAAEFFAARLYHVFPLVGSAGGTHATPGEAPGVFGVFITGRECQDVPRSEASAYPAGIDQEFGGTSMTKSAPDDPRLKGLCRTCHLEPDRARQADPRAGRAPGLTPWGFGCKVLARLKCWQHSGFCAARGFSLMARGVLSIGIGASTAAFSILNPIFFRTIPDT
jgi:hypothetical protein